jgi:transcriptional regulator with XRE-family HTH domain
MYFTMKSRKERVLMEEFYDEFDFEWVLFAAIKKAREKKGLSQRDLAKKIGVEQAAIARLESGRINPTLNFLKKVLIGLDLELTVVETKPINNMV